MNRNTTRKIQNTHTSVCPLSLHLLGCCIANLPASERRPPEGSIEETLLDNLRRTEKVGSFLAINL